MNAKLIKDRLFLKKIENYYTLHRIKDGILTIEGDSHCIIHGIEPFYKLSLKNCQAIEDGYDLCELARLETMKNEFNSEKSFIRGCETILELLGDKKFSEEDMFSYVEYCLDNNSCFSDLSGDVFEKWKSLQPKEWNVEVVTLKGFDNFENPEYFETPKLDAEGCLILKRIK